MSEVRSLAVVNPRAGGDQLPPFLQRPAAVNPVARLHFISDAKEDEDERSRWRLEGSPAVVMVAIALFSGSISRKKDAVSWPAVEAAFDDLLMLQHRFPISVDPSARQKWEEHHGRAIERHMGLRPLDEQPALADRPTRFIGELLSFQESGVRFLLAGRRVLLADDMGLGKTPMALAALDRIDQWPAVVVCQAHVVRHWEKKIEQFLDAAPAADPLFASAPGKISWLTLGGTRSNRRWPTADLYIVHYLVLHAWSRFLMDRGVQTVVFDEAQELRHDKTRKHDAAKYVARRCGRAFGLSGTPIYNRGPEIWTVLDTLNQGCLGTKTDFHRNWCTYDTTGGLVVEDPAMLGRYLRDRALMLRRRKDEVQSQLPSKHRAIEPVAADNEAFAELIRAAVQLAKDAQRQADPFDRGRMEAEAIAETRRATGVAKAPAAVAFLRGLMEAAEPTLVFAHHHAVVDAIKGTLDEYKPVAITGRESMAEKARSQDAFARGDTNLCIIGLRAATGLDGLQARARVVVFAELDWSPAVHHQAEDRAHRMGQANSVIVYYLVTDLGTDPFIMETLNVKESQFAGLMHDPSATDQDRATSEAITKRHMADVLSMLRAMR